jgi:hypothetical protein
VRHPKVTVPFAGVIGDAITTKAVKARRASDAVQTKVAVLMTREEME